MCRIIFFVIEVTYKFFIYLCFVVVVVVLIFSCKNCECLYKEGYSRSSIKKYPISQFLTALDTGFYKHWCILNLFIFTICKDSIIILPYRLFFSVYAKNDDSFLQCNLSYIYYFVCVLIDNFTYSIPNTFFKIMQCVKLTG